MGKVLIAVSGTGGHVYPGIALAEELRSRRPDLQVLFTCARGKPGVEWIRNAGFDVRTVRLRGFARQPGWSWLVFPFALIAGGFGALALVAGQRPDLVIGTGGYVSGPFVFFAALLGIPTLVLEQNSLPGVATRIASRFAREVHVAYPEAVERLPGRRNVHLSGNPVRLSVEQGDAAAFRAEHGLDAERPVVLVLGGSQGAQALTEAALGAGRELGPDADVQIVIQAGRRGYADAQREAATAPDNIHVTEFVSDMGSAYAAARLVVARSGAMTLAELAAAGRPAVLVPYPYAAEDHQTLNARHMADRGAARLVP
ncbi:MAG: UDP-N-acetylglucosamine--N-acetylmuramyl-(pentapeptide) pyrophosphoryl-undecaprenol N-acetylglucosamine transferase, partial [Gemmatimonadetes bacterium]|nr:UDP-N-acetylglucosamine--N-acetylmuramyl-(pentapeptide) pyrophosphoryl-undecaprenol N-acetylglucosamine transferase [Gemmatimonadota bacterium]